MSGVSGLINNGRLPWSTGSLPFFFRMDDTDGW
jgi:hypothetical protein